MKLLMKTFEYRFYPMGHIWEVEINSLNELQQKYHDANREDGKRTGSAEFKLNPEDEWLDLEEFVSKYLENILNLFEPKNETYFIGFQDESGNENYEERESNFIEDDEDELKGSGMPDF